MIGANAMDQGAVDPIAMNHLVITVAQWNGPPGSWREEFHSFTSFHTLILASAVATIIALCRLGRRGRTPELTDVIARRWGLFIFAWQSVEVTYYLVNWDIQKSLPLQICDLVAWFIGLSLFTGNRRFTTLVYFWGVGLSTQAFITPTVEVGFAHVRFWLFFVGHSHIVLGGLYEVIARGYRPTWKDFRFAAVTMAGYAAFIIPMDYIFHLNYAYAGKTKPDVPTMVDSLGPWPVRVVWMAAIVYSMFFVLTACWPANWPSGWTPGWRRERNTSTPN